MPHRTISITSFMHAPLHIFAYFCAYIWHLLTYVPTLRRFTRCLEVLSGPRKFEDISILGPT